MPRPIVITGGGTGGHIFPMRAIADELVARGVGPERIRFVGSRRGQEADLLGRGPVPLTLLPGRGVRRSLSPSALVANAAAVAALAAALARATALVARWRPAVVVSVGGYASLATSIAAVLWRRPLVLVELDAAPGAAQRLVRRFAVRRCVIGEDPDARAILTGAPVRSAILDIDRSPGARERARRTFDPAIDPTRVVVVVMTGSLGSRRVNDAVIELASLWSTRRDRTLVHVTGRRDATRVAAARPVTDGLDYRVVDFADMVPLWAVADVAVCRAGATTVAELTALGVPAVLVPLPGAPGDHQARNARTLADAGAAVVLDDARCTGPTLARTLDDLIAGDALATMAGASRARGRRGAAGAIADVVLDAGGRS